MNKGTLDKSKPIGSVKEIRVDQMKISVGVGGHISIAANLLEGEEVDGEFKAYQGLTLQMNHADLKAANKTRINNALKAAIEEYAAQEGLTVTVS